MTHMWNTVTHLTCRKQVLPVLVPSGGTLALTLSVWLDRRFWVLDPDQKDR